MRKGIFIDMDTLFDTRAGLACLLDKKNEEYIKSGEYHKRLRDNMGNISSQVFHAVYRNRTKKILQLALPTPILKDIVFEDYKELMSLETEMNTGRIPIYINIYPYNLSTDEMKRIKYIVAKVCNGADIILVNLNYDDLSPDWVNEHIKRIYMYDGLNWLRYQSDTLRILRDPMIDVMLIVPTILDASIPTTSIDKNTFIKFKQDLEKFIDIYFIDTIHFCGVDLNVKNDETVAE